MRGEIFDPRRLSEKIEVIGPSIELSSLRSNIFAEIVDTIGVNWDEMFGRLLLFRNIHGHCRVPRYKDKDKKLANWVQAQRAFATKGILSTVRKQRLDDIGFDWNPHETNWEEGYRHLKAYKEREGHCAVPFNHVENGFRLGSWVLKQRSRMNTLPDDRRRRLNELGFLWDAREARWEEGYLHLKAFKQREGHCRVPARHRENGYPLGPWVTNQRARAESLPAIRRQQLDHLGFVWDQQDADWEEGYLHLKAYKTRTGHCQVPHRHIENGFPLGQWVRIQRNNQNLSEERRRQLDKLGFVWDPHQARWEEGYLHLKAFKQREGHCRVPAKYKENGYRLGQWVVVQRTNQNLSEERRQRLDELGFVWSVRQAGRKASAI